jgi:glucokinase
MAVLGIDLGGTKLSVGLFKENGQLLQRQITLLHNRTGKEVGAFITSCISDIVSKEKNEEIKAIGVSVPGISRIRSGTVWAPNIPGWEDYPLVAELRTARPSIPIIIESDRGCSILGERWKGNASGCRDVIFLSVGTGIGAGILIEGDILHGAHDIGGAIGWMALNKPFDQKYIQCGCFEYHASGNGMSRVAVELAKSRPHYHGNLKSETITAEDIFSAYDQNDEIAIEVIRDCIQYWGMAIANLVSLFNPEKIILGGGVFGPAVQFIPSIYNEALKWAQPISIRRVQIEASALKEDSALYGAAYMGLQQIGAL